MRIRIAGILLLCCVLCGCASLLDREYHTMTEHTVRYRESNSDNTLRAENHQDVVNDMLLLVNEHKRAALLRLYGEWSDAAVKELLEQAAEEVCEETPIGAYAVEYIATSDVRKDGFYEVTVRIGYRRTEQQIRAIVSASSTSALPALLRAAVTEGESELAVRLQYWTEDDIRGVRELVEELTAERPPEDDRRWVATHYPSLEKTELIEFTLE